MITARKRNNESNFLDDNILMNTKSTKNQKKDKEKELNYSSSVLNYKSFVPTPSHRKNISFDNKLLYEDSNLFSHMFVEESGTATKRMDFIKIQLNKSNLEVSFGSGLNKKNKGKSPLLRSLKFGAQGDECDDIIEEVDI